MKNESDDTTTEADKAAAIAELQQLTQEKAASAREMAAGLIMTEALTLTTFVYRAKAGNELLTECAGIASLTGLYLGTIEAAMKIAGLLKTLQPEVGPSLAAAAAKFSEKLPSIPPAEITVVHEKGCTCKDHAAPKPSFKTPGSTGVPRGTTPKNPNEN